MTLGQPRALWVIVFITLIAYMGAISRSQALLWLIASLLSAALLISWLWPKLLLRHLSIARHAPQRALEDEQIIFTLSIVNRGWLPCFMIEVFDHLPFTGFELANGEQILANLSFVPSKGSAQFEVSLRCEKRGYYQLGPISLVTGFPLDLLRSRKATGQGHASLTIYPRVFPVSTLPLHGAASQVHRGGFLLPEGSGAAEFSGLREYRRGDNPKHVHWPTTARLNELMIKEFEPLASACMYFALDLSSSAQVGNGRESTLEYAIRIVASVAEFALRQTLHTRFMAYNASGMLSIPSGKGEMHYQSLLDVLAVVDADGSTPYGQLLSEIALQCERGETVLIPFSVPQQDWSPCLQAVAQLRHQGAHVLAVVFDCKSFSARYAETQPIELFIAGLIELGVLCWQVRQGDDLIRVFNS